MNPDVVIMAERKYLYSSRTQKSSSLAVTIAGRQK